MRLKLKQNPDSIYVNKIVTKVCSQASPRALELAVSSDMCRAASTNGTLHQKAESTSNGDLVILGNKMFCSTNAHQNDSI
jgi:hypothetical protein